MILAAVAEIGGCFAFWAWLRLDRSALWAVPGIGTLIVFAWTLPRIDVAFASGAYAACAGVHVVAALTLALVGRGNALGSSGCLRCRPLQSYAAVIVFGPRPSRRKGSGGAMRRTVDGGSTPNSGA